MENPSHQSKLSQPDKPSKKPQAVSLAALCRKTMAQQRWCSACDTAFAYREHNLEMTRCLSVHDETNPARKTRKSQTGCLEIAGQSDESRIPQPRHSACAGNSP